MRWFSVYDFGCNGFWSMVLDDLACINMYCNIERNIIKYQAGSLGFGIQGKSLCICVLCVMLSHCLFSVFYNSYAGNFCTVLKPTRCPHGVSQLHLHMKKCTESLMVIGSLDVAFTHSSFLGCS